MEIRSACALPRVQQAHRERARLRCPLIIHWTAVAILVISQFTVIPMLTIIAADVQRPKGQSILLDRGAMESNSTTVFEKFAPLNP